jgi:hypothetical protein
MLKYMLLWSVIGMVVAMVAIVALDFACVYFNEWATQQHPNWDTAWHIASGFATLHGSTAAVLGVIFGALAGFEIRSSKRGQPRS